MANDSPCSAPAHSTNVEKIAVKEHRMGFGQYCPGSRSLREPTPDDFACPRCGAVVEIWSDERGRTCPKCGALVAKAQATLPECADWCPAALTCLGEDVLTRRRDRLD